MSIAPDFYRNLRTPRLDPRMGVMHSNPHSGNMLSERVMRSKDGRTVAVDLEYGIPSGYRELGPFTPTPQMDNYLQLLLKTAIRSTERAVDIRWELTDVQHEVLRSYTNEPILMKSLGAFQVVARVLRHAEVAFEDAGLPVPLSEGAL